MEQLHRFNSNESKRGLTLTNNGDSGKDQTETRIQSLAGEKYPGEDGNPFQCICPREPMIEKPVRLHTDKYDWNESAHTKL